jgi:hypothetical protein
MSKKNYLAKAILFNPGTLPKALSSETITPSTDRAEAAIKLSITQFILGFDLALEREARRINSLLLFYSIVEQNLV